MRSTTTRATAVEGVRSLLLESERVNPVPMYATSGDPVLSPVESREARHRAHVARYETACYVCRESLSRPEPDPMWRRRALDPEGEGVSPRFRGRVVDMTGRLMVAS